MKNIKRIFVAAAALLSFGASASLLQPIVPMGDETPFRINAGVLGSIGIAKTLDGTGLKSLEGGLGFTHNIGSDFNWGLAAALGVANYKSKGFLFKEANKDKTGFRTDVELMMSYMPELAENVRAGLVLNAGWGDQLTNADEIKKERDFGDFNVKVGIGVSAAFSSVVSGYLAGQFSFHNIRMQPTAALKDKSNLYGIDIPAGLWFGLADHVGLFVEANSRFHNLAKGFKHFKEEVSVGVSYAI